jgi:hypothetical protein
LHHSFTPRRFGCFVPTTLFNRELFLSRRQMFLFSDF